MILWVFADTIARDLIVFAYVVFDLATSMSRAFDMISMIYKDLNNLPWRIEMIWNGDRIYILGNPFWRRLQPSTSPQSHSIPAAADFPPGIFPGILV
jgi:hypothetical protein